MNLISKNKSLQNLLPKILIFSAFIVYSLVFYKDLFFEGLIPFTGDTMRFYYPSWVIGKKMLSESFSFLWDNYRCMGQPFSANPSTQGFYPLRFLSPFLNYLNYTRVIVVFHVGLSSLFGYSLILRMFQDRTSALFGALGMGFNGFFISRMGYQADFCAIAWIPVSLYFYHTKNAWWLGGVLALQWLAGFPPISILTIFLLFAFAFIQKDMATVVLGILWMGGLIAFQFLPFLELLKESGRPIFLDPSIATEHSIPPAQLLINLLGTPMLSSLKFHSVPLLENFYLGPIYFICYIWGLVTLFRTHRKRHLFILISLGFLFLSLSVGKCLPLYSSIPGITLFRAPANWTMPFIMIMIVTSCYGIKNLPYKTMKILFLVIASLDLLAFSKVIPQQKQTLSFFRGNPIRLADLSPPPDLSFRIFHIPKILNESRQWGQTLEDWETLKGIMTPSFGTTLGFKEAASHNNLTSQRNLNYVNQMMRGGLGSPLFDYAGVKYIVSITEEASKKNKPEREDFGVIQNKNAKGRVFIDESKLVPRIIKDNPGSTLLEAEGPGRLVLSESFFPGWRVSVDGIKTDPIPFENYFLSTPLSEGKHVVKFEYSPASFRWGGWVSLITLFIGLGLFLIKNRAFLKPPAWFHS